MQIYLLKNSVSWVTARNYNAGKYYKSTMSSPNYEFLFFPSFKFSPSDTIKYIHIILI